MVFVTRFKACCVCLLCPVPQLLVRSPEAAAVSSKIFNIPHVSAKITASHSCVIIFCLTMAQCKCRFAQRVVFVCVFHFVRTSSSRLSSSLPTAHIKACVLLCARRLSTVPSVTVWFEVILINAGTTGPFAQLLKKQQNQTVPARCGNAC